MSLSPALEVVYKDIRPNLVQVDAEIRETISSERPHVAHMLGHLESYGGKRLRPALVMLTARAAGANILDGRFGRLGAVVELIHLATLVHDDVIDEASLRRKRETVNARWSNYDAVLLGDVVFSRAINLLARLGDRKALLDLTAAVSTLCEGEILQNRHRNDVDLNEEMYYGIIEAKTAILFGTGCELAAHLAGAPAKTVKAFYAYGMELGKAFQIADDCLDITGKEEVVGKSLGTDLRLGKMTLPLIMLRECCSDDERLLLRRVVTADVPVKQDTAQLGELLSRTSCLKRALTRAHQHAESAVSCVLPHVNSEAISTLRAVASFVMQRKT